MFHSRLTSCDNFQIGKIALSAWSDPQSHAPGARIEFQIVDDEEGLRRAVDEEPCLAAFHFDLVLGPDPGLQIDVGLVLLWSLLPRFGEVKTRMRTVLGGMVSPDLVVGPAVS